MEFFEFPNGSRIIRLSLNISEKLHWQHVFEKNRRGRDSSPLSLSIWYNTPTPWIPKYTTQTNGNHRNFFMRIQIRSHVLVHSVDKIYVVVVKLKLIWSLFLNIFYFNFFPTPNQSLRFTRFRRSYVNRTVVVPTNHCQS